MLSNSFFTKLPKILIAIVLKAMALFLLFACNIENKKLIIYNNEDKVLASYDMKKNDYFSIEFMHSVNMSKVIEYYRFDDKNNIYVYKTVYYNYGAGVETELENDETMRFGEDGSMIIENINKEIPNLTYYLSNIFDHTLRINDGAPISLWEICGKNKIISFKIN